VIISASALSHITADHYIIQK